MRSPSQISVLVCILSLVAAVPARGQQEPAAPAAEEEAEGPPVSPRGAFLRSLVLPGWGQAYAGAPGRGAVYFALTGSSLWMTYIAHRQRADAEERQGWLRSTGELEPEEETVLASSRASQFEDWAALSIFLVFLSGADAYVSAYLSDFDERIGVMPGRDGSLQIEARIPVGGPR